jgi:hypothetical protein
VSIEIVRADDDRSDTWNGCVERSPHANPFHQYEALQLLATHSGSTLHPLIGYKEREPIGIFPFFERRRGPLRAVHSPPRILESFPLGPALADFKEMHRREAERYKRLFIDACIEQISDEIDPEFTHVRTSWRYADVRPFKWNSFEAAPFYTYVVDLTVGEETAMNTFSRDARSNIRNTSDEDYAIRTGGAEEIELIIKQVRQRLVEQGQESPLTAEFVTELYERLPSGQVRPYVCEVDETYVSGIVVLEYGGISYRWQGGVKPDTALPVTDLLDWYIMRNGMARNVERYDLVGANMPRLCRYKSKFDPDLRKYFNVKRRAGLTRVGYVLGSLF